MDPWDGVPVRLPAVLSSEYGLADLEVRRRWVSSTSRFVLEVASAGETLAVKIDSAPEPATLWGVDTQEWVSQHRSGVAPGVRRTRSGLLSMEVDGSRVVVSEWVRGGSPGSAHDWWQVGRVLARLHRIEPIEHPFGVPYGAAIEEIRRDLAQDAWACVARPLIERLADLRLTPVAIIHGEPAATNVKIASSGATLLDWDQSGIGAVVLDLGFPLIREFVTHDLEFRVAEAVAFYSGYRSEAGRLPSAPEDIITAAFFWAIRFMAFHDRAGRWRCVEYAVAHENQLRRAIG